MPPSLPGIVSRRLVLWGLAVALAPRPGRAQAPPEHPDLEPAALERLKAATARLKAARSLAFTAVTTYESPARNGQPLSYATLQQVAFRRPDRLRVITPGDGPASDFYYDGKTMVAFAPAAGLAAVEPAPPTLAAALQEAYEKAAIYFPFAEFLAPDPYANLTDRLVSAFYIGQSHVVGDTVTDMVALATDKLQAQVWIGIDDGLVRRIRVTYPGEASGLRHQVDFSHWQYNPNLPDSMFTSAAALKAPRMAFARPDVALPAPKKN